LFSRWKLPKPAFLGAFTLVVGFSPFLLHVTVCTFFEDSRFPLFSAVLSTPKKELLLPRFLNAPSPPHFFFSCRPSRRFSTLPGCRLLLATYRPLLEVPGGVFLAKAPLFSTRTSIFLGALPFPLPWETAIWSRFFSEPLCFCGYQNSPHSNLASFS